MAADGESIKKAILAAVPADGSTIGNQSLLSAIQGKLPELSDDDYLAARDQLISEGVLGRGRGRGGSVFLLSASASVDDEAGEETDDGADNFELTVPEAGQSRPRKGKNIQSKQNPKPSEKGAQVLSYRHTDKRVNNPEVGMVDPDNDPDEPKIKWTYDPHIDPALMFDSARSKIEQVIDDALASGNADAMQAALKELRRMQAPYLAWAGKAERTSFEIDTVSLHVHERVDPATILANARKILKGNKPHEAWRQADLFAAPFENLPLRQALDFYHHEKGWSNRLIAGDSLLVMNSLLKKEAMTGKVQMIYIDPPYGIRYGSNFQPFIDKRDVKDGSDEDLTQEPEMIKAFRDTWELGIHSYLTYLRDRLLLSKELLSESGSIFIQISDENLHLVRQILDEVFGSENFVAIVNYRTMTPLGQKGMAKVYDYVVWYASNKKAMKFRPIYQEQSMDGDSEFSYLDNGGGTYKKVPYSEVPTLDEPIRKRIFKRSDLKSSGFTPSCVFNFEHFGIPVLSAGQKSWRTTPEGVLRLQRANRLFFLGTTIYFKQFHSDFPLMTLENSWTDTAAGFSDPKTYVVQTHDKIISRCMLMTTDPGDLVFDPTSGSGTTAVVAERWGRRWIVCDTSRVANTLAKQRLMTASFDYYTLRYPHEGLKGGFIYAVQDHVTLGSISTNPDVDSIYEEKHPAVDAALKNLNYVLKQSSIKTFTPKVGSRAGSELDLSSDVRLYEWEVPFDCPHEWPSEVETAFEAFHVARCKMQSALDAAVRAHSESEVLYDKPEVDKNRLRITGPFSVEAVPAPTVLSLSESSPAAEADATIARSGETSRQTLWRDELMKTGIRAKGGALLEFSELEAIPGVKHVHASGALKTGEPVAVSFGPEHAALEQKQVERAIEEARKLVPKPKFIVFCAFTFDPEAAKDIDEAVWPGVTLLKAQMNTDLLTEDLKKARSSNQSFWLMGQPDVEVHKKGDEYHVEVNGFDYFDPRKGELVSGGKGKIAMWSLDTDYDGRSLMPHQVFFPMAGAKDGWNRLRKTIRAELDEALLEQFHGTISLPFKAGDQKRIAVKIVDDRGIESLKIIGLE